MREKPVALEHTTFRHVLVLHSKATLGNGNRRYFYGQFIFYLLEETFSIYPESQKHIRFEFLKHQVRCALIVYKRLLRLVSASITTRKRCS